jgi:hypothetical protein
LCHVFFALGSEIAYSTSCTYLSHATFALPMVNQSLPFVKGLVLNILENLENGFCIQLDGELKMFYKITTTQ